MALNYDTVSAMVRDKYIPNLADNIFESSALLRALLAEERISSAEGRLAPEPVGGGEKIIQPLEYAKTTAVGTYSNYDTVDVTPNEIVTAAEYEMKNYFASIVISQDEEEAVAGSDLKVLDLLSTKMKNAEKSLKDRMASDLYTGSGNSFVGLNTAIGTTNTYGGIDGNTYTWWQSTVDTTAHTAANMKDSTNSSYMLTLLQTGLKDAKHMNESPNLLVCSQSVWDIYESVVVSAGYRAGADVSRLGKQMADAGFQVLHFRGVPMVVDDYIDDTADAMYAINTNYLKLYFHPQNRSKMAPWDKPANQHARIAQITFKGQLAISNRRMFYRWSDLNN